MTRSDIIRMAREAGFYGGEISSAEESFVHFAALVAAAEQGRLHAELERCRQVCTATAEGWRVERDALLEALKMMAEIIDKMSGMPVWFIHPSPWQTLKCEETLKQARAAIKAAEGEKE